MKECIFKAIVVAKEITLSKIAKHFGIVRESRWDAHCVLEESALKGIVLEPKNKKVFIFSFGSMVFVNCEHHEKVDILKYLKKIEDVILVEEAFKYMDDYKLTLNEDNTGENNELNSENMIVSEFKDFQEEIIATVLAKSVALEKLEEAIDVSMDEIEHILQWLKSDKLYTSDRRIANLSAKIMEFKVLSISYLGILDKPDITWNNDEASLLFEAMNELFEINERNSSNERKMATLMDVVQVFANLVHARRGNRLEWAVIILIAIEIIVSLLEWFSLK